MIDELLAKAKREGSRLSIGNGKFMPGMYVLDDVCYVDATELCTHYGVPETKENVAMFRELCQKFAMEVSPEATWANYKKGQKPN